MRILQINAVSYGSTGRIMFQLADAVRAGDGQTLCTAGFTWKRAKRSDFVMTGGILGKTMHTYLARVTGRIGCFSSHATRRLLRQIEKFQPDVIHLHNLHGWFLNLPMLFGYLKKHSIPVVWTLHDCWSFTGHCPHFDGIGCEKYRTGCHDCTLYRLYPGTYFDHSKAMYAKKRRWFNGVENLTLVTPSRWLAGKLEGSFLKEYPVQVIHNGIDRSVFRPCEKAEKSSEKYTVLGVSYGWDHKKGLDVFLELAKRLGPEYRIVLVGTDEAVEAKLPPSITPIRRTQNQQELAQLYSGADVFVNPTREDTFPTVNMEALACGTGIVTFATGGSPESPDERCGIVVPKGDVDAMEAAIRRVCQDKPFSKQDCLKRAELFDGQRCIEEYLELYERVTRKGTSATEGI